MSVVKVTCYTDGRLNKVETLPDDSPEAQTILRPPPPQPKTIEDRIAILEAAAQLPDGIPEAFRAAQDAAAVVQAPDGAEVNPRSRP